VLSLLHHALRDKESVVRIVAETNIRDLHDKSSIVPLIEALGDDSSIDDTYGGIFAGSIPPYIRIGWRGEVINVLSDYGTEAAAALPLVRRYIKGDFPYSGPDCKAIRFVGILRDRTSVSLLIPLVTGETKTMNDYIECAVEALGQIGDPKAVPALEKYALNSDVPKIREAAVKALANIRSTNTDLPK
jgi:HEAT repeat protein